MVLFQLGIIARVVEEDDNGAEELSEEESGEEDDVDCDNEEQVDQVISFRLFILHSEECRKTFYNLIGQNFQ